MQDALPYESRSVVPLKPGSRRPLMLGVSALTLLAISWALPRVLEPTPFICLLLLVFIFAGLVLAITALVSSILALLKLGRKLRAICGLVAAVLAFPALLFAFSGWIEWATGPVPESKEHATQAELSNLISALETFRQDNGRFPTTAEGLDAMAKRPPGFGASWHQILDEAPNDKWGKPYYYTFPDPQDATTFDIFSAGPDGIPRTADDITKAAAR